MKIVILEFTCMFFLAHIFGIKGGEFDDSEDVSFIFLSLNEGFSEDNVNPEGKGAVPQCQDDKLMSLLESVQVINPESVIALATKNKLQKVCMNTSKTITEMESYLKSCKLLPDQETYNRLLKGISTLHKKVCTKNSYQKSFIESKNCFSKLQSEYDSCNGPADWSENSDAKKICKAYQEIVDCYYIKTSMLCGNSAADVFKELVNNVVQSVITVDCRTSVLGSLGRANTNMTHQQSGSVDHHISDVYLTIFLFLMIPQVT